MSTKISPRDKDIITKSFKLMTRGVSTRTIVDDLDWSRYFNVFSSSTGDNRYINPIPQPSPATDPRYGRFVQSKEGGMGSLYKEVHEDHATLLTITPGVPEFAGLLAFITNMFSPTAAIIANKGRAPGIAYHVAEAAGSILFWPMQLFSVSIQFLNYLVNEPTNNFYSVKPTMGAYTMAANGVLNDIMVKMGFVDPILPPNRQQDHDSRYGRAPDHDNSKSIVFLQTLMPDVINKDGTIDLLRLVTKGARKHRFLLKSLAKLNKANVNDGKGKFDAARKIVETASGQIDNDILIGSPSYDFVRNEMTSVSAYRGPDEAANPEAQSAYTNRGAYADVTGKEMHIRGGYNKEANPTPTSQDEGAPPPDIKKMSEESLGGEFGSMGQSTATGSELHTESYLEDKGEESWLGSIKTLLDTAANGGMDALTWRVEGGGGAVTDSFSNSMTQSPMASKFNSITKEANNFMFDIAGGATGIGIIDGVVNMLKDAGTGFLSGTVIGNIPLALANNSYIKVPDHWDGSTTSLHKESYTLYFDCTYAHPYEQIMKIWVPFSLLLPLVAPLSAGGSAYTSPYYVKAFCQSRQIIRTGMVERMDFTFGEGEAGWTAERLPLNMKVTMEIVDLEPLVSVPIDRSLSISNFTNPAAAVNKVLTDDTAYNNYLARLTSQSYLDTVLKYPDLNRRLTGAYSDLKRSFSSSNVAAKIIDTPIKDLIHLFGKPISR